MLKLEAGDIHERTPAAGISNTEELIVDRNSGVTLVVGGAVYFGNPR